MVGKLKMGDLKISIITPSYNQGCYIEETIQSVINQNYDNIEYIIIDGASTDNTVDVINKYESNIDYWISEPDNGQSEAINKGLAIASGDIIAWLNSDDQYFSADVLSQVAHFFSENKSVHACYGNNVYVDAEGDILYARKAPRFYSVKLLQIWNYIHQPTVFIRKDVAADFRINNSLHYIMDYEYWLRITTKYDFKYLDEFISASRWHSDCKTIGNTSKFFEELEVVQSELGNALFSRFISPLLLFRVLYNCQRIFTMLFLFRLVGKERFLSIKIYKWKALFKRQLFGLRFGS